jgi:hypothetical protein
MQLVTVDLSLLLNPWVDVVVAVLRKDDGSRVGSVIVPPSAMDASSVGAWCSATP